MTPTEKRQWIENTLIALDGCMDEGRGSCYLQHDQAGKVLAALIDSLTETPPADLACVVVLREDQLDLIANAVAKRLA